MYRHHVASPQSTLNGHATIAELYSEPHPIARIAQCIYTACVWVVITHFCQPVVDAVLIGESCIICLMRLWNDCKFWNRYVILTTWTVQLPIFDSYSFYSFRDYWELTTCIRNIKDTTSLLLFRIVIRKRPLNVKLWQSTTAWIH